MLAKVEGDRAWFYRDIAIWQVEISSGQVLQQYRPFSFPIESHEVIRSYTIQGNGQLFFVMEQGNDIRYVYLIDDTALKLVAINAGRELLGLPGEVKRMADLMVVDENDIVKALESTELSLISSL